MFLVVKPGILQNLHPEFSQEINGIYFLGRYFASEVVEGISMLHLSVISKIKELVGLGEPIQI
jgi:hypothetical protein